MSERKWTGGYPDLAPREVVPTKLEEAQAAEIAELKAVIKVLADRVKCQADFNGSAEKAVEWAEQQVKDTP